MVVLSIFPLGLVLLNLAQTNKAWNALQRERKTD